MLDVMGMLTRPLSAGREITTRKIIRQFAHKFDFVYFGSVNQHKDEHELIRGITVSSSHADNHFCVGSFHGRDISLVERANSVVFPKGVSKHYRWIIMQFDLAKDNLPHVFIDGSGHDEEFYITLFMKFGNMSNASTLFTGSNPLFARSFKVFAPVDKFDDTEAMLSGDIAAMLAHHFKQFNYEIDGDQLLVYAENPVVSPHLLHEMLRVGHWLADKLD